MTAPLSLQENRPAESPLAPASSGRPLYIVPFGLLVVAFLLLFLVGALAGAAMGWFVARRALRAFPPVGQVIEPRVELKEPPSEASLADVAARFSPVVGALVNAQGRVVGHALALTDDGVLVTTGVPASSGLQFRGEKGTLVGAGVIRVYPEARVTFLRVSGSFAAPDIAREPPRVGVELAAVAQNPSVAGLRVRNVSIEQLAPLRAERGEPQFLLGALPVFATSLPSSFQGSPVIDAHGTLAGVVLLQGDTAALIPGDVLNAFLEDTLRYPAQTEVSVVEGLEGRWESLGNDLSFHVTKLVPGSLLDAAGLNSGDRIRALGGESLGDAQGLVGRLLDAGRQNKSVTLDINRDGKTLTLPVKLTIP